MPPPPVRTERLTKVFGARKIALNDVSLTVSPGSTFGLLGPNGAGKTTLIKLLLGLQLPTAGRAWLFGSRMSADASHLRRRIGFLPTHPHFPGHMTPIGYLDFLGRLFGLPYDDRKTRLANLLRAVGLLEATGRRIKTFSTGMITRLGIAAALLNDPELLLLDEPTAGLDPTGRRDTLNLVRWLGQAGTRTILISSHILSDIERVCDSLAVINEGTLIFSGSMAEFKQRFAARRVDLGFEGPQEQIYRLAQYLQQSPTLAHISASDGWLTLALQPDACTSLAMAQVLQAAHEHGLQLTGMASGSEQVEEAYLSALQQEQTYGFQRGMGAGL